MVSNRHVNSVSMKRFKRVHIQHKVLHAVHTTVNEEPKPVQEQVEESVPEIIEEETRVEVVQEDVLASPKPKAKRKKKVVETEENNEEKPEDNG